MFVVKRTDLTVIEEEDKIEDASNYGRKNASSGAVAYAILHNIKNKHNKSPAKG